MFFFPLFVICHFSVALSCNTRFDYINKSTEWAPPKLPLCSRKSVICWVYIISSNSFYKDWGYLSEPPQGVICVCNVYIGKINCQIGKCYEDFCWKIHTHCDLNNQNIYIRIKLSSPGVIFPYTEDIYQETNWLTIFIFHIKPPVVLGTENVSKGFWFLDLDGHHADTWLFEIFFPEATLSFHMKHCIERKGPGAYQIC